MGLSSSKQKTKTSSNESATTTPTVPAWITDPLQGYTGKVTDFLNSDPASYVAPASPLQEQAFAAAESLGAWKPALHEAIDLAKAAATTPAPTAMASTYEATPATVTAYDAPIAAATTYEAPRLGAQQIADVVAYDAPKLGSAPQVGSIELARTVSARPESLLADLDRYLDPATRELVDAALASYDAQSGRDAAALTAQGARGGAFGGSRFGIREGAFAADTNRNRTLTEAELRARAFGHATQLADADAARRQSAGIFNASAENERGVSQGQMDLERLLRNAGLRSDYEVTQAGLDAEAARTNAAARNSGSMFNAELGSKYDLTQSELEAVARQNNANSETGVSQFNAAQAADAAKFNAGAQAEISQFNASQAADAARFNAGQQTGVSQFNSAQVADAANRALEAAGVVGSLGATTGANDRADIGFVAELGEIQRIIDQAYASAPLVQLQAAGQLFGALPYGSYTGQQVTGSSSGTTTSTSKPSLFSQALAAAAAAASF